MQVPYDVREARRDELVSLQQDVGQDFAESLVGRQVCKWHACKVVAANFEIVAFTCPWSLLCVAHEAEDSHKQILLTADSCPG